MHERLTDGWWAGIAPIFRAILDHPFLQGLADGTLPEAAFRFYIRQDALYLRDYARALALAAAKAPEPAACRMFAEHAGVALVVEQSLHADYFRGWGIDADDLERAAPAPTTLAYCSYLQRIAYAAPFEEVVGALLPCYWIYWEVGKSLAKARPSNPLYRRWIDTYASGEYGETVRQVIALADRAVAGVSARGQSLARRHFDTTSRYEWMFWDAAWRQERWPVGGETMPG